MRPPQGGGVCAPLIQCSGLPQISEFVFLSFKAALTQSPNICSCSPGPLKSKPVLPSSTKKCPVSPALQNPWGSKLGDFKKLLYWRSLILAVSQFDAS